MIVNKCYLLLLLEVISIFQNEQDLQKMKRNVNETINIKSKRSKGTSLALILLSTIALGACSNMQKGEVIDAGNVIYDPYEDINRKVMDFNVAVDHAIINPIVIGYRTVTPKPARTGLRNFLRNLRTPVNLANQILQGDIKGTRDTVLRAIINSTVGVGGLFDVAGYEGIEYEFEDFGQTLAKWGVGHGPYMVVPFIGASSFRDYGGFFADSLADPVRWYLFNTNEEGIYYSKFGLDYLDVRDSLYDPLTELEKSSFDYYAAVRSTYYQHRRALVHDNSMSENRQMPDIPVFDDDF